MSDPRPQGCHASARLKKRRDFLHVAGGRKAHGALCTLQHRSQREEAALPRVGLTVTKKVGTAVERNRIKRRLRESLRTDADLGLKRGHDYVVVGRRALLTASPAEIGQALRASVRKVHEPSRAGGRSRQAEPARS